MILCCGEALIDMIAEPTVSGARGFVPHTGGAILNTAVAMGRLGESVGMLTGVSTDMFGQQLINALKASHVDVSHVIVSDRPTTLAFVQLEDGHATYSFVDENTAGRMLAPEDMPDQLPAISALYLGGISLACEPCADAYASLLAQHGNDRPVMLDPNIRPGFIQDQTRFRTRLNRMIAQSDIVKVSDEDLDWIIPGAEPEAVKAALLLQAGPSALIVTRGGDGANGYLADGSQVTVPVKPVQVVDTIGAGDTFNAGVLTGLSRAGHLTKPAVRNLTANSLRAAMELGAEVAAVTVSRAGAEPPWDHEL
ncbi:MULTISPECIES: carbohydrate kinase [unclassified Ruegeria]|uniref:carbohydrate kinase family protein n=1 Tax=unclassified Ruegeria TaxID=2625375 RepID=UPI001492BBBC|nr:MULTISPECIES: carbohydrate kinase [unclassified Ruegeria]NOD88319.1 carbohydrate kinase [Ruegeria sp. HKCCD4318]NOE13228.1 carbohydrate kinase [Ruegeria sp. HKCCD4318-2]NOG11230.1 carbohydrate kinase [Ruegeria sp. HKCCD4315]